MEYVQCTLKRGKVHTNAWIPTVGKNKVKVKVGSTVELVEYDREKWEVVSMGQPVDAKYVKSRERDYKKHRKATDI